MWCLITFHNMLDFNSKGKSVLTKFHKLPVLVSCLWPLIPISADYLLHPQGEDMPCEDDKKWPSILHVRMFQYLRTDFEVVQVFEHNLWNQRSNLCSCECYSVLLWVNWILCCWQFRNKDRHNYYNKYIAKGYQKLINKKVLKQIPCCEAWKHGLQPVIMSLRWPQTGLWDS